MWEFACAWLKMKNKYLVIRGMSLRFYQLTLHQKKVNILIRILGFSLDSIISLQNLGQIL